MALSCTQLGADYVPVTSQTVHRVTFRFQLLAIAFFSTVGLAAGFLTPGKLCFVE